MDTSYRVSYASVWGMLLLRFLHPSNAKNFYARYLAGIIFHPCYYTDFIWRWNCDRTELDVVRHLATCAITQEVLDNAYPWALVWIDQHSSVHFRDHNQRLEVERQDRICQYGELAVAGDFRGWWSPDHGDTHHIQLLLFYEQYEYQSAGHTHTQDNPYWLLCGEDAMFSWLNEFPLMLPGAPLPAMSPAPDDVVFGDEDVPMTPNVVANTSAEDAELAPNSTDDDAADDEEPSAETDATLASDLDRMHIVPRCSSA
ncbi:hypothetical protein ARMGADRAFT_1027057 [Armillaria gallica]|uniref:HNH nuclease domain-containing protein n=1 Tax=Armillaria gallica TaxID=47427 RepID=A0A2H3DQS7_ARMGA|nr:hypothetical protein ARMGADRAFT_1027057 [Armillaria gallica]